MFTGFPSTNTPSVKWWNFANISVGTSTISLENDCAPIQYFATGGSTTAIKLYLPICPADGKAITITNVSYKTSTMQTIQIYSAHGSPSALPIITLGCPQTITLCFIAMNTQGGPNNNQSQWVSIGNTSLYNSFQNHSSVGGTNNTIAEGVSVICGGSTNTITGGNSFIGGVMSNIASNLAVVCGGSYNTASGMISMVAGGQSGIASGYIASVLGGESNTASGTKSATIGANYGSTRGISGCIASGSGASILPAYNRGQAQLVMLIIGKQTTDASATVLVSDTAAPSTTNQIILPNNSAYYFRGECVAGKTAAGDAKGWYIEGVIKRGANAASTVLVGTPTVTSLYADAGATTWNLTATADITNGGLAITATGQAATTIQWVAQIRTTEMTY